MRRTAAVFLVVTALATGALAAAPAKTKAKPKPESKDAALVELFLKTPTAQLPPDQVEDFMAIDPKTLPKKLREPYAAKKAELMGLRKVYTLNSQGFNAASAAADCLATQEGGDDLVSKLQRAGFQEITHDEELWLIQNTRCQEPEMQCKFSLQIVDYRQKKKPSKMRYFLYCSQSCDPLMALIGFKRSGNPPSEDNGPFGESNFPRCH